MTDDWVPTGITVDEAMARLSQADMVGRRGAQIVRTYLRGADVSDRSFARQARDDRVNPSAWRARGAPRPP